MVIPKKLREQAGLKPGMELEVRCREGRIELEPAEEFAEIVEEDGFLIGVPRHPTETLAAEHVQRLIDEDRAGQGRLQTADDSG